MPVAAFGTLGNTAKDLLYGSARGGKFVVGEKVLNVTSKTADGVEFNVVATGKEDKLDMQLKAAYAAQNYSLVATMMQSGKLGLASTYKELVPGLNVTVSGTVPDVDSGKVAVVYTAIPHIHATAAATLTAAPKVDVAATTGFGDVTAGGEASYDTAKSAITKWTVGVGYTKADYQAAVTLNDQQNVTALVAHKVTADTTLGAEAVRNLTEGNTTFAVGLTKAQSGGTITKLKLDNSGIISVLYEQEMKARTKLAVSGQFSALDTSKPPKFGFGYNIAY
ncbi:voltage-dependent anion-selective channel [Micractinium conductrix]|uniref:Voltage-dependent anion-selective channel n=1 Tax=Micractinium conductrix TaxID=554055 RepID=A0A2P6VG73_9CHLO|nr:voltage-dependent anion-selective channel [Micractinium conductrix]|eukprot:PSC73090.1 voltage-dependent anion-selective channel [Micractinium conductrix]